MDKNFDKWFKKNKEELRYNFIDAYADTFMDYCEAEYTECKDDYA